MAYEGVADELAVTLVDMGADNFAYIGTRATARTGCFPARRAELERRGPP